MDSRSILQSLKAERLGVEIVVEVTLIDQLNEVWKKLINS